MPKYYKLDLDKVQRLAFERGYSLSALCTQAGMNRSRVVDWRKRNVSPATVKKIADVLECEPSDLITGGNR